MTRRTLYDAVTRSRAAELYDEGYGVRSIANMIHVPRAAVRKWIDTYGSVGIEGLMLMGRKHAKYSFETKLAAARAVVDEGMTKPEAMARFGIASTSPLRKWLRAYREEGPEALRPKPKGRPKAEGRGCGAQGDDARAGVRAEGPKAGGRDASLKNRWP